MNYRMVVEIPITGVPNNISEDYAKQISEKWLIQRISDARIIEFKEKK